ncbi:unnamed protein product [Oppiella nova]|uniref:Uncharacterized protein n=1 Tax=Oppiella nova TaxID=334625 RepID=A0A7R9QT97_9ACAR|nr:unnamed protein product [Oppiella nova]CAG2174699.1 unnamed protein product [Oppiella nova]
MGVWWGSVGAMKCTIDIMNRFHNDKVGHFYAAISVRRTSRIGRGLKDLGSDSCLKEGAQLYYKVVSEVNQYNRLYEELRSLGSGAFGEVMTIYGNVRKKCKN